MAGKSTSAKRIAAINKGGSISRPQRTTTKLVPQMKTISSARSASRGERWVEVMGAPSQGHHRELQSSRTCKEHMGGQAPSVGGGDGGADFLDIALRLGGIG